MKHKLLSILLCLAMALSLLPTAALAKGEGATGTTITTSEALAAAIANAQEGATITLGEGTFTTYGNASPKKSLTFVGSGTGTVWKIGNLDSTTGGEGNGDYSFDGCDTITFKNMTLKSDGKDYRGFIRINNTVVDNCTINGKTAYWGYDTAKFQNGTIFIAPEGDYALWDYSSKSMTFDNCKFNISGKGVNVYVEAGNAGSDARTVTVKDCTVNSTTGNKAFLNIKNSTQAYEVEFTGNNKVNGLSADTTTGSNLYQVETTTVTETSGKPVKIQERAADGALTTVYEVEAPAVAKIGDTEYPTLVDAFKELNAKNHTLTLIDDSAWTYDNVYWKAGTKSGSAATLKDAMEAAYANNAGSITIICKPNATITKSPAHINVTGDITVYANGADFGGNDLSIGTSVAPKNKTTTINIYDAKNLVVWGQPVGDRADVWNVNFTDCVNHGSNFLMYRGRENGKATINATLTGCKATGFDDSIIHTTADGRITIKNCEFANNCAPVNIAHKQAGEMMVTVENSTFTNCGETDTTKDLYRYAAPVRIVNNNAAGTVATEVTNCTFADTVGNNGDILIGDGRDGKDSNDVTLTVKNTAANVQAQKPGYYNGANTDDSKKKELPLTAADSLNTTIADLLPVTEVDLDEFIKLVTSAGYSFDGSSVAGTGKKLTVKWSPVSGCFDNRGASGHICTVNNVAATGNTPKKVRGNDAQFYLMEGMTEALSIKNVSFEFEPKAFTVCDNSREAGTWSANKNDEKNVQNGQLYVMTSGNVTVENCEFDKVVLTMFNTTGTSTVKNCNFANVYNSYAIKDIRGENISVTGTTIENCGGGIMASQTANDTTVKSVDISDNVFKNVDVADTAAEGKVGTRAILQIASSGNYTDADFTLDGNTATNCGPILRQLNESFDNSNAITKVKGDLTGLLDENGKLTYTGDSLPKTTEENPNPEKPQPTIYTVKFSGSDVADMKVASGTTITLPTAAKSGYTFKGWKLGTETKNANDKVTISSDTTFTAVWQSNSSSSGSSGSSTSAITTPSKTENGTVTVSPRYASKGDTVTVSVKPNSGYVLETLTVTDKNGNELTLKDKGNGKYTFTMPAGKVEVKATFMEDNSMLNFFYDVPNNAYFYEAVKWAVENGITTGVGNDLFAPEQPCTRAQIVTFLWRAAGSPEPKGAASGMSDVVSGSYYEKAVAWAIENGITTGTTTSTFSPDATCTRAQAVTFLARALKAKAASAAEFSDVPTDSYFADAVAWAAANGVTEGIGGGLFAPDNDCTRGQIVTFLYRAYNK